MTDFKKIGNRYYKKEVNEHGVEMIYKATYDVEKKEYRECGKWVASEFADIPVEQLDGNTQNVRNAVITLSAVALKKEDILEE